MEDQSEKMIDKKFGWIHIVVALILGAAIGMGATLFQNVYTQGRLVLQDSPSTIEEEPLVFEVEGLNEMNENIVLIIEALTDINSRIVLLEEMLEYDGGAGGRVTLPEI